MNTKFYSKCRGMLLLGLFSLSSLITLAQDKRVTGKVSGVDGQGIPGASILVKGSQTGTTTGATGEFAINIKSANDVIIISSVGYSPREIKVGSQSNIGITMTEDISALEEVVVTGYGSQSKRDITGAVTTVNARDLQAVPATTFAQQLQGRASGLSIVNDATPGGNATVRIRGFGTTGNNDPLYVIDGVPTENSGNLNPNDIETIQILKDASSASIYGSRAGNGVIIITTKKGKAGVPKITFSTYYGTQKTANDVQVLNAKELGQYLYAAGKNANIFAELPKEKQEPLHGQYTWGPNGEVTIPAYVYPSRGAEGSAGVNPKLYSLTPDNIYPITKSADTDWWRTLTQTAPIQNYQLSASGGSENGRYALSLGYFSQDAVVKFVGYDRYTLRANTEFSAINKRLRVGENFTASFDNRRGGYGNNQEQNAVSGSYKHHPLLPIYDVAGNFAGSRGENLGNNSNPYAQLDRDKDNHNYRMRVFGNAYTEFDIIKDLTIKTSFGIDLTGDRGTYLGRANPEYVEGSFNNGSTSTSRYEYQWTWQNTLSYSRTFNTVHKLDTYVGVESIKSFGEFFSAGRNGYAFETTPIISYLNLGDPTKLSNQGFAFNDYTLWSQFGKLNYAYDGKYLVQFILRNDASSRFLSASRSALFPAFSLGWRLSDEKFMKDQLPVFSDLKLRFGYGKTGNQKIGDYNSFTTYRSDIYHAGYPIDGNQITPSIGYDAQAFGNPNAKWETTTTANIGLDGALFNSKLTFELDIWNRVTSDMLFTVPITFTAGDASAPALNVGQMTNKGIDFGLNYKSTVGDFRYSVGANISSYKNNVDKLTASSNTRYFGDVSRVPAATITQAGSPLSSFFGYKILGIFQSDEEAKAWAPYAEKYNRAGKFKVADVNGDGKITDDDRTIIGNPHPDFVYGLNLNFGYKAFDLTVFVNGSQGNDVFNYVRYFSDFNTFQGNRSKRALYEAWSPTNTGGKTPIPDANDQVSSRPSSYFIEDGSYLRIKNVQLTFNVPKSIGKRIGLDNAQLYIQAQNLATFTKYTGLNPEITIGNNDSRNNTIGFDGGNMPVSRTILFGLNLGF